MAEVVGLSGQSFPEVWGMTWPEYKALSKFWGTWPPAAVSLAIMAKLAPQMRDVNPGEPTSTGDDQSAANFEALTGLIGSPPPQS